MKFVTGEELWDLPEEVLFAQVDKETGIVGTLFRKSASYGIDGVEDVSGQQNGFYVSGTPIPFNGFFVDGINRLNNVDHAIQLHRESGASLKLEMDKTVSFRLDDKSYFLVLDRGDVSELVAELAAVYRLYPLD